MTARICEVTDTLGDVVKKNGEFTWSKSIQDIGERRTRKDVKK